MSALSDAEVLQLIREGRLKTRDLETVMKSLPRAVGLRRQDLATRLNNPHSIDCIPFANYDYRPVMGQCCEEVRGHHRNYHSVFWLHGPTHLFLAYSLAQKWLSSILSRRSKSNFWY